MVTSATVSQIPRHGFDSQLGQIPEGMYFHRFLIQKAQAHFAVSLNEGAIIPNETSQRLQELSGLFYYCITSVA